MSAASVSVCTFKTEALNVIFEEVRRAIASRGDCQGVAFECGHKDVSVMDVLQWCNMGRNNQYPRALWKDICFAMRLIARVALSNDLKDPVRLSEDFAFQRSCWTLTPLVLGDNREDVLLRILSRIDEEILRLDAPLQIAPLVSETSDLPQPRNVSYPCPHCGVNMLQEDGGEHMYCPDCLM